MGTRPHIIGRTAMIKQDFVESIADKTGLNKVMVKSVLEAFLDELRQALCDGRRVELRNLGVFTAKKRKRRVGRNPRTGESVPVPERIRVCFKLSRFFSRIREADADLFHNHDAQQG